MAGIGTLAGGIAHEFNNMLGGISGCAQDALEENDPGQIKEALRIILRTSERACTVVENLLRFSRKTPSEPVVLDLPELAADTLRLLEGEFTRAGIDLERDFGEGCRIEADPSQMQQVFLNLLTNALHAVEDGAERRIRVAVCCQDDAVVATVDDSGPGIPEAAAERIFDPFFTTKDGRGAQARLGTGLGLSVTYGILEAHGGTITAGKSRLGGAEFAFRMPRASAEA
jgi:signal transduction histidine kinase